MEFGASGYTGNSYAYGRSELAAAPFVTLATGMSARVSVRMRAQGATFDAQQEAHLFSRDPQEYYDTLAAILDDEAKWTFQTRLPKINETATLYVLPDVVECVLNRTSHVRPLRRHESLDGRAASHADDVPAGRRSPTLRRLLRRVPDGEPLRRARTAAPLWLLCGAAGGRGLR